MSRDKRCQGCQGTKGAKNVRGQKVPRVPEFKRCQGCLGQQLRRSTQGQGFLKNSFQIELDSWRRSILFFICNDILKNETKNWKHSSVNPHLFLFVMQSDADIIWFLPKLLIKTEESLHLNLRYTIIITMIGDQSHPMTDGGKIECHGDRLRSSSCIKLTVVQCL